MTSEHVSVLRILNHREMREIMAHSFQMNPHNMLIHLQENVLFLSGGALY